MAVSCESYGPPGEAVEVTLFEYFLHRDGGKVKEVWVSGYTLVAEMQVGYIHHGQPYSKISCELPPAFLENAKGFKELADGLPADAFHDMR